MSKDNFEIKLNQAATEIKNIRMTDEEKKHIFENVVNSPVSPYQGVASPFQFQFIRSVFQGRHLRAVQYVSIACLILLLSGSGVGFAAKGTLPGNALYGVKVNVLEPVNLFFKLSAESRAKYESSLVSARLEEAETLAAKGELDDKSEERLSNLLENHTSALNNYRAKLPTDENTKKVDDDIVKDFEHKVNARVESLDKIRSKENIIEKKETKLTKAARASIQKVKGAQAEKEEYQGGN